MREEQERFLTTDVGRPYLYSKTIYAVEAVRLVPVSRRREPGTLGPILLVRMFPLLTCQRLARHGSPRPPRPNVMAWVMTLLYSGRRNQWPRNGLNGLKLESVAQGGLSGQEVGSGSTRGPKQSSHLLRLAEAKCGN